MQQYIPIWGFKKLLTLMQFVFFIGTWANGQNVGIGTNDPTTNLHIQSSANTGLRVQSISGPGSSNIEIQASTTPNQYLRLEHRTNTSPGSMAGLPLNGLSSITTGVSNTAGFIMGTLNNANVYLITNNTRRVNLLHTGAMSIGEANPHVSALLDIQGTTGGLLIPRLTTTQRNAIATPTNGLMIYNTNTNTPNYYKTGTGWTDIFSNDTWQTTGNYAPAGARVGTLNSEPLRFVSMGSWAGAIWSAFGSNTFFGYHSGPENQAASEGYRSNTAIGSNGMTLITTGAWNTSVGAQAGQFLTSGSRNVLVGIGAGFTYTTQSGNVAIGSMALFHAKGNDIIAIGDSAYIGINSTVTPEFSNIAIGKLTLRSASTAAANTIVGFKGGYSLSTGSQNTILGYEALYNGVATNNNVAIGYNALNGLQSGTGNVAVGHNATLKTTNGIGAIAIGINASAGGNNSTAIGYYTSITGSEIMGFGNEDITSWVFGRTERTPNRALEVGTKSSNGNGAYLTTGGTWTNNSDVNLKEDITPINTQTILQKIAAMPITRWKYIGTNEYHIGPMAQDFYAAFNTGNDDKSISSIDPAGVALAAIQALVEQNKILQQEMQKLKKQMAQLK